MYSTFFLGTLYLEQVRHYSALQTGAAFLPWTLTVAVLSRGITARLVDALRALRVLTAGMRRAIAGLLLLTTVGPHTAFFPTIFFACFAIGLGIGNAFMPLLTIAMADVPAADAGLGSGITNVSQQISGALGLAVLSTLAANHTKGLAAGVRRHHVPDQRLPPRLLQRSGGDRRRHRPRPLLLPRVARTEAELGELPERERGEPSGAQARPSGRLSERASTSNVPVGYEDERLAQVRRSGHP